MEHHGTKTVGYAQNGRVNYHVADLSHPMISVSGGSYQGFTYVIALGHATAAADIRGAGLAREASGGRPIGGRKVAPHARTPPLSALVWILRHVQGEGRPA